MFLALPDSFTSNPLALGELFGLLEGLLDPPEGFLFLSLILLRIFLRE
jgi:hypothetical protein